MFGTVSILSVDIHFDGHLNALVRVYLTLVSIGVIRDCQNNANYQGSEDLN